MDSYFKKSFQIMFILALFSVVVYGSTVTGSFDTCSLTCNNRGETSNPITNNHPQTSLLRGKSGPRGEKGDRGDDGVRGEPGISCDRNEIEQLQNRILQLETDLTNKVSKDEVATDVNGRVALKEHVTTSEKWRYCGVGMQSSSPNKVKDSQITASSYWNNDERFAPHHGRLHGTTGIGFWAAGHKRANQWIQVDLEENKQIYGVVTQGEVRHNERTTSYRVSYQQEGSNFDNVVDDSGHIIIFQGNSDKTTPITHNFPHPINARIFRITVLTYNDHPSIRFDLITC